MTIQNPGLSSVADLMTLTFSDFGMGTSPGKPSGSFLPEPDLDFDAEEDPPELFESESDEHAAAPPRSTTTAKAATTARTLVCRAKMM